ncbi:hypothetical protein VTO42DRAFT_8788 [Malbranchea cinnamomea]
MTAPRSAAVRALRALGEQHSVNPCSTLASMAPWRRSLHVTGAYSAQPATGADMTSIYRSRSLADLRSECERRNLRTTGSKAELVDRLANHDHLQSRAFSIAMRRIDGQAFGGGQSNSRQFNTSRAKKAVHDSSPIDFVFMPRDIDSASPSTQVPRVPILPDSYTHYEPLSNPDAQPMKPQIYTVSGGGSNIQGASPMSDVVDNQSLDFDPFNLTETVRQAATPPDTAHSHKETVGAAVKELWSSFLDDVLGPKQGSSSYTKRL